MSEGQGVKVERESERGRRRLPPPLSTSARTITCSTETSESGTMSWVGQGVAPGCGLIAWGPREPNRE